MEKHFESFLRNCVKQGHTSVKLVSWVDDYNRVTFYAHGLGGSAPVEPFKAVVEGQHVRRIADVTVSEVWDTPPPPGVVGTVLDDEDTNIA